MLQFAAALLPNMQHAAELLPRVISGLHEIPKAWGQMEAGPLRTQAEFLKLVLSFRR